MKETLTLRERVIKRPGMYFGDIEEDGANAPIYELLANAIDQFLIAKASTVSIQVKGCKITVHDDGAGFNFDDDLNDIDRFLNSHHDSATADDHAPHIHISDKLGGLGLAILNVASEHFSIESSNGTKEWRQDFVRGEKVFSKLSNTEDIPINERHNKGTKISLTLDKEIFQEHTPNLIQLRKKLFETAHLFPKLIIKLNEETFCSKNGLLDFAYLLAKPNCHSTRNKDFSFSTLIDDVHFQVAAIGNAKDTNDTEFTSWSNGIRTVENGSHVEGLKEALDKNKWKPEVALINVVLHNPRFAGPCKDKLLNQTVKEVISKELSKRIQQFLQEQKIA